MSAASFAQRLRNRETLIGTLVSIDSPAVAEILASTSYDWLFIDCEHGPLKTCLPDILRAAGKCPCLVRIPSANEVDVKFALDLGATGVIVPQVNTPQQASDLVKWSKYSPQGQRGVGACRAQAYGSTMQEYLATANDETVVVVQSEHVDAVENCEAIAATPGIDALFIGPFDLSSSLGVLGQVEHPSVKAAIARVVQAAQTNGKAVGGFALTPGNAKGLVEAGTSLLTIGIDALMLRDSAEKSLNAVKKFTMPK